jgi:hypothetical protein
MPITTPVYSTRETMKRALDINETARNSRNLDRAIQSASRRVEGLCHRYFYPLTDTKSFSWPNAQGTVPWRLYLENHDLISVSELSSGGTVIAPGDFYLEPEPSGPPYTRLEVNIGSSAAFGGGSTHQRNISVTGLWGYRNDEIVSGVTVEALDASETTIDVDALTSSEVGVGSIIRIDSERCLVTNRTLLDTGINLGGAGLTAQKNDVTVTVSDATQFAVDEIIKIESESVLVVDISGNNLTVLRGYDGSTMAAHAAGVDIYAPRTLKVTRGALGTTAATHLTGATVNIWDIPSGIMQLTTAEAIHELMQEQTGWFRTMSASSNFGGTAKRAATIEALIDLRQSTYAQYGRKARTRAI